MKKVKLFIFRTLLATGLQPMPDEALDTAVKDNVMPRPLQSDINRAKQEMEEDGFIFGEIDPIDKARTWILTAKGLAQANQL